MAEHFWAIRTGRLESRKIIVLESHLLSRRCFRSLAERFRRIYTPTIASIATAKTGTGATCSFVRHQLWIPVLFLRVAGPAKNEVDGRGRMPSLGGADDRRLPCDSSRGNFPTRFLCRLLARRHAMLVMRSWYPKYDGALTATLSDGRVVRIVDTFPKSGVYDSRTLQPVWQIDWYAHESTCSAPTTFSTSARIDRTGYRRNSALLFYDNGKLIRSYACTDLLTGLRQWRFLPYSTWDWHEQWYEDFDPVASEPRSYLPRRGGARISSGNTSISACRSRTG